MNTLALALGCISATYLLVSFLLWYLTPQFRADRKAAVVVLGDLGHSPRMCFHALSIAKVGCPVDLIGYKQSELMTEIVQNNLIRVIELPKPPQRGNSSYIVYAIKRALKEHLSLYRALKRAQPTVVLVQNPPSIPTLGVARFVTLWTFPGCKLLIDWHNLGYSILAMSQKRWIVTLYRAYEIIFGKIAYLHLTVSVRLGFALKTGMGINPKRVIPLYDRPYQSTVITNQSKVRETFDFADGDARKDQNCAWVITSTSYTPDEDIGMLLDALEMYKKGPFIKCIVTGKGPLKEQFLQDVAQRKFPNASVHTAWLSYERYHELLACCDLGISLHKSSSGWDLPMKVVDMFGAGIPVLALNYPALKELVKPENGITFNNAATLAGGLEVLQDAWKLAELKEGALEESKHTWFEQWKEKVGPVFGYGAYTGEESSSDSDHD